MIELKAYNPINEPEWNDFVKESRNGTFLFNRGFMDYHSDRFEDASIMAYRNGKLCALLPANKVDDTLWSHQGLTYGGWVVPKLHFDGNMMVELWDCFIEYCRINSIKRVVYKAIPYIYPSIPSQEDIYALFRHKAILKEVNLSSTIDMSMPLGFNMSKRQQLKKASQSNLTISTDSNFDKFWEILEECLSQRHNSAPIHSLEEIKMLSAKFPDNIRLFTVSDVEGVQAGVCVFDTGVVAHAQYTATTEKARKQYYLTYLYHHLIYNEFCDRRYFDFGTSNENHGLILNEGLLNQKYSMGGTGVAYSIYEIVID